MDKSNFGQVTKALDNLQVSGILYRMWLTLSLHLAGLKVIWHKLHLIQTSANHAQKRLNLEHLTKKYLMMSGSSYDIYPFVQCTLMSWNLTPQAQSSEFNIIRKLKNVPWRDNCAWGVKYVVSLSRLVFQIHKQYCKPYDLWGLSHTKWFI